MIWMNGDRQLMNGKKLSSVVVMNKEPEELPEQITYQGEKQKALLLYDPAEEYSVKLKSNTEIVLKHLLMDWDAREISRTEEISYSEYDLVILASMSWEKIPDSMTRMAEYVENGGKLFLEVLPEECESQFVSIYRKLGIIEYSDYIECDKLTFEDELIPGVEGMSFGGEGFGDVCLAVGIEEKAKVYAYASVEERSTPYIWNYSYGEGTVTFFNGTAINGDYWRGIIAGCINSLYNTVIYPIINANCIFIDDFPSPQYESTSDVVRKEYNRSVKEFYRDIWWPDMQQIAERYNDVYTCLFVATYNDIVEPEQFTYIETSMEQYYGNSMLRKGYEMGAHGYNHQSLTLAGGTPESFQYNPWENVEDMKASLDKLEEIADELFPSVSFETYVPPSNYLSKEGREAVKLAFSNLKGISGVYTAEGEVGEVYVQDFVLNEDGIAEFPRISSGMVSADFDRFAIMNGVGTYGVFSHFIHPDDIFDAERGKGKNWETLYASYCDLMKWVHETWPFLRSMTASEAADALQVYAKAVPYFSYSEDRIKGVVDGFLGEMFFFLKTDKKPLAVDDSCRIEKVAGNGTDYYVVTVKKAGFEIKLVEK